MKIFAQIKDKGEIKKSGKETKSEKRQHPPPLQCTLFKKYIKMDIKKEQG